MKFFRTLMYAALPAGLALVLAAAPQNASPRSGNAQAGTAATYAIDSVHSTALFRVQHLGAGQFWGRFNDIEGTFAYAESGDAMPSFDVTIKTESVDTNNGKLDNHLRTPDFFNAKEYPEMTFTSSRVQKAQGDLYKVTGDLTIRGVTKTITADIEWTGASDFGPQAGGARCGFEASFTIDRGLFNVSYGLDNGALGREVKVIVALEGVKQQ